MAQYHLKGLFAGVDRTKEGIANFVHDMQEVVYNSGGMAGHFEVFGWEGDLLSVHFSRELGDDEEYALTLSTSLVVGLIAQALSEIEAGPPPVPCVQLDIMKTEYVVKKTETRKVISTYLEVWGDTEHEAIRESMATKPDSIEYGDVVSDTFSDVVGVAEYEVRTAKAMREVIGDQVPVV